MRGSLSIEHTLARRGAERLRNLLGGDDPVRAVYVSGWQVAGDANLAGEMYPDQSLYPADSVPSVVRRINNALRRADQIHHAEGNDEIDWFVPIVADAEAGFGGALNCFELMRAMIDAGAAAVHFEDQLASEKKCGHMGGKVLLPTAHAVRNLVAARLAADVEDVPTLLIARTDALGADLIWCETGEPDLEEAARFAEAIHEEYPERLLTYNCSPSFNWKRSLSDDEIAAFHERLADLGYRFQFTTLAGFHTLNHSMFELAGATTSAA